MLVIALLFKLNTCIVFVTIINKNTFISEKIRNNNFYKLDICYLVIKGFVNIHFKLINRYIVDLGS